MAKRLLRITIVIIGSLLLTSCSTKLSYNFLDWWITWNVKSYISLEREQRRYLTEQVDQFHRWHRRQELPRYRALLQEIQQQLQQSSLTRDGLKDFLNRAIDFWDTSLLQMLQPGAALLTSLDDKQVAQLAKKLAKDLEDAREDELETDPERRKKQRLKRLRKWLSPWTGRLDRAQKAMLERWVEERVSNHTLSLEQQSRWQTQFLQLLEERHQPNFAARLQQLVLQPEDLWPQPYRDSIIANQRLTQQLLVDINNSLSDKQQRRRDRTLQNYIDDFSELATLSNP